MRSMHRFFRLLAVAAVLATVLLTSACTLNSGVINTGETYLNGSWYHDDGTLRVGYNFFENGTGFLFIGTAVKPIRYGVYMNNLYLEIDGELSVLPFGQEGDELLIQNLRFLPVTDPENGLSADQSLEQPGQPETPKGQLIFLIAAAAVVVLLIAAILIRYFRSRSKPAGNPSSSSSRKGPNS